MEEQPWREVEKEQETVPERLFLPTADIFETDRALTVVLEIPGVNKENVGELYGIKHRPLHKKLSAFERDRPEQHQRGDEGWRADVGPAQRGTGTAAEDCGGLTERRRGSPAGRTRAHPNPAGRPRSRPAHPL